MNRSLEPRMNADKRGFQALTPKVRGNDFLLSASIRVNPRFFPPRAICVSTRISPGLRALHCPFPGADALSLEIGHCYP